MNEILRNIHERRAVRKFKDLPVESKLIDQILDAGRMAPSAMNKEPWKFYVLSGTEKVKALSREIAAVAEDHFHLAFGIHLAQTQDAIFHSAPLVIFISAPLENDWAQLDIGMCAQNMMLAAKSIGLASCPVGLGKFVEKTKSYPMLHVPADEYVVLSVVFGYGDELPEMRERKKDNAYYF